LASTGAHAATIKLATWNRNNLHHVLGEPLRSGAPARSGADYDLLRKYRDRVDADVIALQEVNGPMAAGLVFSPNQYDLYFSARYIDDLVTGKATNPDPEERSDRMYTGFAVRRGVFDAVSKRDVPSLGVIHGADGRPVRWGHRDPPGEGWAGPPGPVSTTERKCIGGRRKDASVGVMRRPPRGPFSFGGQAGCGWLASELGARRRCLLCRRR
jgi:hypothetical protein